MVLLFNNREVDVTKLFAIILLIYTTFFWGSTFILVKNTIKIVPLEGFITIRFFLAYLLLKGIRFSIRQQVEVFNYKKHGVILGVLLFLSYWFQTIGLQYTTPSNAAFITGLSVILVPIIYFTYKKSFSLPILFNASLATTGLFLISVNLDNLQINYGDFIIIGTAITIALHILYTGKLKKYSEIYLVEIQLLTITICSLFFSMIIGTFWNPIDRIYPPIVYFTLFITSVLASAFAFWSQTYAQKKEIKVYHISLIFLLEPVFALILDMLIGVKLDVLTIIGMIVILISLVIGIKLQERTKIIQTDKI
jgi:drug/metabolite transporter (DMT)-like permease